MDESEQSFEGKFAELRRQAEAQLAPQPEELVNLPLEQFESLVHELRVHQLELEMQNEQLRQTQLKLEVARDQYADLYDFAPVGYFTLNDQGLILAANLTVAALLGVERASLIRRPLGHFIVKEDQDTFNQTAYPGFSAGTTWPVVKCELSRTRIVAGGISRRPADPHTARVSVSSRCGRRPHPTLGLLPIPAC